MDGQTPANTLILNLCPAARSVLRLPPTRSVPGQGDRAKTPCSTPTATTRAVPISQGQGQHGKPTEPGAGRSASTATTERTLDPPAQPPPDISHSHGPPLALTPSPFRHPFPPEAAPRPPHTLVRPAPSGSRSPGSKGLGRVFLVFGRQRALLC